MTITTLEKYEAAGYELPDVLDDATKTLIDDWFGTRYLVKEHFDRYMKRQCNLDFPRYLQLLRIDPVSASYDWFVDNYLERQVISKNTGTDTKTGKTTTSGTTGRTTSGSSKTENDFLDTLTHDTTVADTNESTVNDTAISKNVSMANNAHDGVARVAPMSAEYTAVDASGTDTITDGENSISISYPGGMVSPAILNPSSSEQSREHNENGAINNNSGKHTTSGSGSHTTTGTESTSRGGTGNTTTSGSESGTTSGSSETDDTTSHDADGKTQEIATGRNEDLGALIAKAAGVIRGTSAWIWFRDELDKCFIQCYNVSDDDFDNSYEVE